MLAAALFLSIALQDADVGALVKEYQQAQKDWGAARRAAKTPEERQEVAKNDPAPQFLPRFREAARASKGESQAEALSFVFQIASGLRGNKEASAAAEEAAKTMLAEHPASPRLEQIASMLEYSRPAWAKAWLREVTQKSGEPKVKAAAMLSLSALMMGAKGAERDEAVALLKSIVKDFPDTPAGKRAAAQLFEAENLQIGCTAPDFEAKDVDGVAFKLSDYRGKVVVLDFWGFW